jgi:ABC-type glycerol-3-phosphate transport system substrate-binding protein
MKTARFVLALAAASVLAACGSDTITSPSSAAPRHPRADVTPGDTTGTGQSVGVCGGSVVTVLNSDGSTTTTCNSQLGSGG